MAFSGWLPFATDKRLPEWRTEPRITPRVIILHSIVGSLAGADTHFRHHTSIEAHMGVGLDGEVWQWQNTNRQADANFLANDFAISIETADNGNPDSFPWTDAQVAKIIQIINFLLGKYPSIKRQKVTSWDGSGIGYHVQFGAPGKWTPVAKTCPGRVRIKQLEEIILPKVLEEEDMPSAKEIVDELMSRKVKINPSGDSTRNISVKAVLQQVWNRTQRTNAAVKKILEEVAVSDVDVNIYIDSLEDDEDEA